MDIDVIVNDSDAARMNRIYRYQRHIYDATRKSFLLGRGRLISRLEIASGSRVLEVGCGTGRNLILLARRHPCAKFYGFDISRLMLETARRSVSRSGLIGQIGLTEGDATNFTPESLFGVDGFERIVISYALSMIPSWRQVLQSAYAALSPGGELHIVDFGQQTGLPRWFKTGLTAWLARFTVEPRAELEAELQTLASLSGAHLSFERLHGDFVHYAILRQPLTSSLAVPILSSAAQSD